MMLSSQGASVAVSKLPCRALEAVGGAPSRHLFLAASCSVADENEVALIEFTESSNAARVVAVLAHPNEVWSLAAHPTDARLLLTVSSSGAERAGLLLRSDALTDQAPQSSAGATAQRALPLQTLCQVPRAGKSSSSNDSSSSSSTLRKLLWHPADDGSPREAASERFLAVSDNAVRLFDVHGAAVEDIGDTHLGSSSRAGAAPRQSLCAAWDPHHTSLAHVATGGDIETVDLRSMEVVRRIERAHEPLCRDMDCNPNKPHHLVSCGDDRSVKFWDVRKPGAPVKVVPRAHSHWASAVRYNRFHDQLVLSAGTDGLVQLLSLSSISSAPLLDGASGDEMEEPAPGDPSEPRAEPRAEQQQQERTGAADQLVRSYEDHVESVYGAAWSACDAWVFATLSSDGMLAVNRVPTTEKYKILL
jgi:WD40 repeat protein